MIGNLAGALGQGKAGTVLAPIHCRKRPERGDASVILPTGKGRSSGGISAVFSLLITTVTMAKGAGGMGQVSPCPYLSRTIPACLLMA